MRPEERRIAIVLGGLAATLALLFPLFAQALLEAHGYWIQIYV